MHLRTEALQNQSCVWDFSLAAASGDIGGSGCSGVACPVGSPTRRKLPAKRSTDGPAASLAPSGIVTWIE